MTFSTGNRGMLSLQRETRPIMRERKLLPRINSMAGLAPALHLVGKLTFMDVVMTGSAAECSLPGKLSGALRIHFLIEMTGDAGNRGVSAAQRKTSLFMISRSVADAQKIGFVVACFTLSAIGPLGKLTGVGIRVAIGAMLKVRNMKPEFPARILLLVAVLMTGFASYRGMLSLQRESCRVVGKFGLHH
jgi:hypothetical protein